VIAREPGDWHDLCVAMSSRQLADVLRDETALWRGFDADAVAAAHAEVAAGGWPLDDELYIFVDGESMAEGGVEGMLAEVAAHVRPFGVDLRVQLINAGVPNESDYVVQINGQPCVCWAADEWEDGYPWDVASTRPLARVNQLLAATGADVRIFILYPGGNEGIAVLLDPRISEAMRISGLFPRDIPILP